MDRIKRLSMDILDKNTDAFGTDYDENKKILNQITIVRSKSLKNQIAGYITNLIKKQIKSKEEKENSESDEKEVVPSESDEKEVVPSESDEKEVVPSESDEKEVIPSE